MRKTVGLALGGGGARGYAHIGVINVLKENKVPIDYISGTSIGAVVGAYYALHENTEGIVEATKDFRKRDVLKLVDLNNPKKSIIKGKKIRTFLERFFKDKEFKDTKIPLRISATDIRDGSLYVFEKGKIIDAVIASASIPGILPVAEYRNKKLVDGGIVETLPLSLLQEFKPDVNIGVNLYMHRKSKVKTESLYSVLEQTYTILISRLSEFEMERSKNTVILRPDTGAGMQVFSFEKGQRFIRIGEKEAWNHLKDIKRLLK